MSNSSSIRTVTRTSGPSGSDTNTRPCRYPSTGVGESATSSGRTPRTTSAGWPSDTAIGWLSAVLRNIRTPSTSASAPVTKFIGGDPMNDATNRFAGRS